MNERLDAIEKQLGTITPGPWSYGGRGLVETVPEFDLHRFDIMPEIVAKSELLDSDAEFIANAPTDIDYLLTLARKQAAALEAVKALHVDGGYSQGYTTFEYGSYDHACITCGSFGEYGVEWPCETYKAATK